MNRLEELLMLRAGVEREIAVEVHRVNGIVRRVQVEHDALLARKLTVPTTDAIRDAHAAYVRAKAHDLPIPDEIRDMERIYQRIRKQLTRARDKRARDLAAEDAA